MLASFKKLNNKKDEKHTRIPSELLKVLNQELPAELKYVARENGMCILEPNGNKFSINMLINIPEIAKKYKGTIKTVRDLAEYAYRTQQALSLNPYEDNTIIMNGHRIRVDQLITFPLDEQKKVCNDKFFLEPPPFDEVEPIALEAGKVSLKFNVERKPYDSMHEMLIQLSYKDLITIDFVIDEKTLKSKWTIHTNINTTSARELYEVVVFYNCFGKGQVKYKGERIGSIESKSGFIFADKKYVIMLERLIKLEEKLGVMFRVPQQFSYKEHEIIEQLYTSLILNKPFKITNSFDAITFTGTTIEDIHAIKNKELLLTSCNENIVELFGEKISLYLLQAIFHMKIEDIENCDENTTRLKIDKTNEKMLVSYRYFTDEMSVIRYQSKNKNWIDKFKYAKEIK